MRRGEFSPLLITIGLGSIKFSLLLIAVRLGSIKLSLLLRQVGFRRSQFSPLPREVGGEFCRSKLSFLLRQVGLGRSKLGLLHRQVGLGSSKFSLLLIAVGLGSCKLGLLLILVSLGSCKLSLLLREIGVGSVETGLGRSELGVRSGQVSRSLVEAILSLRFLVLLVDQRSFRSLALFLGSIELIDLDEHRFRARKVRISRVGKDQVAGDGIANDERFFRERTGAITIDIDHVVLVREGLKVILEKAEIRGWVLGFEVIESRSDVVDLTVHGSTGVGDARLRVRRLLLLGCECITSRVELGLSRRLILLLLGQIGLRGVSLRPRVGNILLLPRNPSVRSGNVSLLLGNPSVRRIEVGLLLVDPSLGSRNVSPLSGNFSPRLVDVLLLSSDLSLAGGNVRPLSVNPSLRSGNVLLLLVNPSLCSGEVGLLAGNPLVGSVKLSLLPGNPVVGSVQLCLLPRNVGTSRINVSLFLGDASFGSIFSSNQLSQTAADRGIVHTATSRFDVGLLLVDFSNELRVGLVGTSRSQLGFALVCLGISIGSAVDVIVVQEILEVLFGLLESEEGIGQLGRVDAVEETLGAVDDFVTDDDLTVFDLDPPGIVTAENDRVRIFADGDADPHLVDGAGQNHPRTFEPCGIFVSLARQANNVAALVERSVENDVGRRPYVNLFTARGRADYSGVSVVTKAVEPTANNDVLTRLFKNYACHN
ncbi:MAG: hypothetical protein M3438_07595 [Pseudomonadota bacterium]|nr:hypothetical protein [Pseudomonadota bacterium]